MYYEKNWFSCAFTLTDFKVPFLRSELSDLYFIFKKGSFDR